MGGLLRYFLTQYLGVLIGIAIGATVTTLTTLAICADPQLLAELIGVQECISGQL